MALRRAEAYLLRRVEYGDNHVIAHFLSPQGRFAAIAYGARSSKRRFAGGLQPLRLVDATYKPRKKGDLFQLVEVDVLQHYPTLEASIESLSAASYAIDLIRSTWQEGVSSQPLFQLLHRLHHHLDQELEPHDVARLTHQFELQLLSHYGWAPAIEACSRCGEPAHTLDRKKLSRRGEGIICPRCRRPNEAMGLIADPTWQLLYHLLDPSKALPADEDLPDALRQASRVLENAIHQILDRPLTSRSMLLGLLHA